MRITRLRMVCGIVLVGSLAYLVSLCATWSADAKQHSLHSERTNPVAAGQLVIVATGERWFGKPIYQMKNTSRKTFHQVSLRSWSDEYLPILSIGRTGSVQADARTQPPYELSPGQSLWFVGPTNPPVRMILNWYDPSGPRDAIVEAAGAKPAKQAD